ncbi:hypothetical protein HHK36_023225 [Tetracentron sinense]|uniref:Cytochrome P450 n=1 Tax=Tetracentron sinense TaxID=13715 RepID=A0A834YNC4_TETSI|nr:hypothetical protein HHK36_023225 [Tetracentron sinense]
MYGEHLNRGMTEVESCDIDFIETDLPSIGDANKDLDLYELEEDEVILPSSSEGGELVPRPVIAEDSGSSLQPSGSDPQEQDQARRKLFRSYQAATVTSPISNSHEAEMKILRSPGFLKPEALVQYLGKMDLITQHHLHMYWVGKEEVNVYPLAKKFTLTLASCFFLGLDNPERVAKLVSKFDDITFGQHSVPLNFPGTAFYRASKAARAIRKELELIIKEKKEAMSTGTQMQDVLSHMIMFSDPTGRLMPETEIANKIMGLLVAGYSAVATALTFLMKYVGERPDVYEKILSEQSEIIASKKSGELLEWDDMQKMKYSWNAACEGMRLTRPLRNF